MTDTTQNQAEIPEPDREVLDYDTLTPGETIEYTDDLPAYLIFVHWFPHSSPRLCSYCHRQTTDSVMYRLKWSSFIPEMCRDCVRHYFLFRCEHWTSATSFDELEGKVAPEWVWGFPKYGYCVRVNRPIYGGNVKRARIKE